MKQIVHIIHRDKFTTRYINFMEYYIKDYQHLFITKEAEKELDVLNTNNVIYIQSYKSLLKDSNIRKNLEDSYKIIVTGIFGMEQYLYYLPKSILKKTYFHFWGGDFYIYRNQKGPVSQYRKWRLKGCIKKIAAAIMLVDGDYPQISSVLKINKKYFVAPMPDDPAKKIDYETYRNTEPKDSLKRILLGNSATDENQHIQMLETLSNLKNEKNIRIICPLSYGNETYRDIVIKKGKEIFGERFVPVVDYMDIEEYIKLLSTCDVGIFNNNRQQALGNIWILLRMGKKIYIRSDNSMWQHFENLGFKFFDATDILGLSMKELCNYNPTDRKHNLEVADSFNEERDISAWQKVFND